MKKFIVSLLIAFFVPVFGFFNDVNASETLDFSKVQLQNSLEKNTIINFESPEEMIKIQGNTRSVLEKSVGVKKNEVKPTKVSDQATNDSPNNAAAIDIGGVYKDYITEEGQQKWYRFENSMAGKLTVVMQTVQSTSIDYDLHLFKLNEETMTLEEVATSSYGGGKNEQLSKLTEGGIYYIAVNSVSGADPNSPFALLVQHSPSHDQNEPDDNIYQASAYLNNIYLRQTIDNGYDMDWIIFQVDEEKTFTVNLNNPSSANYQLDIFDPELNALAGLGDNTNYSIVFPAGTYLLRVQSTSLEHDADQKYTLDIREKAKEGTSVVISNIGTDDNVEGYIDYGYGYKYRIKNFINVKGQLFDENGITVPNANVEARIVAVRNDKVYMESSTTDRNGNFIIEIPSIQEAAGKYAYTAPASHHYFDIIPIVFLSNGNVLDSNENSLYHFAYSTYRPH
ncbi:carboxypeptidase-like regulatory domain-containing protein [Virgibacillus sp. Bac330]|uniref:carboxypeptidase-like regulatory domain-containing protein n=1 Tax=Virgibacillus sp. Bac330 TaxID=2419841 RepID=UPI000EF4882D|nr:carboxypeptidase-like regulatory domain-containing protein [Virgibacillus sp. Bac330]